MSQSSCLENKYRWIYPEVKDISSELIKAAGSRIIAQLLVNRGIDTPEKVKEFLDLDNARISSPHIFEDMDKAVSRINLGIEKQEHIVVYGDFDADGVTSTSLLFKTLRYLGANASYFIPDRSEEGHGLNRAAVCKLISSRKAKLIITVDCGISNMSEVTLAKGLGTDIIITDHHEAPEDIPPAYAILNPKLSCNNPACEFLAGVGVAYKLASALLESNNCQDFNDHILCLAAVGTIADVVPLLEENRIIVHKGLKLISTELAPGLMKLIESAGCKMDQEISADMIAFGAAPRINAIGRLAEASLAVDLLISDDPEEINTIAQKLNYNNKVRQQMCESTFVEATNKVNLELDLEQDKAIILADPNWHPGIIGIVASKLVEKYNRPALLISVDKEANEARCSARGVDGLNLHEVLNSHSEIFEQFGGHAFAAGFSFDLNKISFEELKDRLAATINMSLPSEMLESKLKVDVDLKSEDLTIDLIDEINRLAPFGESNPSPVFSISNLNLKQFKTMGSNNNHLKIFLSDDNENLFEAVWWQKSNLDFAVLDRVNVAFSAEINNFGGKTKIQLVVKDIQSAGKQNPAPKQYKEVNIIKTESFSCISPRWIDHRSKNGFEKTLLNYFKTSRENTAIFAEKQETLELLGKDPALKSKAINRLNLKKVDQLMLLDLPCDKSVLSDILDKTESKIIHLIGKTYNGTDPGRIIKTLSGMLKYAHVNKNGEISIDQAASFLYTSKDVIFSGIKLLGMAKVIEIIHESPDLIKFKFLGSSDLSSIISLDEYNYLIDVIKSCESFRFQFVNSNIEEIQNLVR